MKREGIAGRVDNLLNQCYNLACNWVNSNPHEVPVTTSIRDRIPIPVRQVFVFEGVNF